MKKRKPPLINDDCERTAFGVYECELFETT
jgi:hypothetical protein